MWCKFIIEFSRKDHLEELLKFYYGLLSSKLRELGYDPDKVYPEAELRKDIKECVAFRYPMSLMHAMVRERERPPIRQKRDSQRLFFFMMRQSTDFPSFKVGGEQILHTYRFLPPSRST